MEKNYSKKEWLNPMQSYATSYVATFDGKIVNGGQKIHSTFLSISDCQKTVRLYKTEDDTFENYINKIDTIIKSLEDFKIHLYERENTKEVKEEA